MALDQLDEQGAELARLEHQIEALEQQINLEVDSYSSDLTDNDEIVEGESSASGSDNDQESLLGSDFDISAFKKELYD